MLYLLSLVPLPFPFSEQVFSQLNYHRLRIAPRPCDVVYIIRSSGIWQESFQKFIL